MQPSEVYPHRERERRVKSWMLLLALGVIFLVLAFIVVKGATKPGVVFEKVSFTTEGLEPAPVEVAGLLMKPAPGVGQFQGQRPGIVFSNGITGSKEWYIQWTRPLVLEGFVVLSVDLEGHGGCSGHCTYGDDEIHEMWAAAEYLRKNVPEVNPDEIVAMGHSLGGMAATRAAALQPDERFSSTVAIWCWTSFKDALQDMLGPIDDFVGRGWRFTTFSKYIDINAPDFERKYSVLDIVDDTRPPNYLLMIGSSDELVSVTREEELIEKTTVVARNTGPENKVKKGYTYGDFADGTARRLVVTNDDHVSELASGPMVLEAVNWIKQCYGIPINPTQGPSFLWPRLLGIMSLAFGLVFLSMGALSLTKRHLFAGSPDVLVVETPWGSPGEQGVWEVTLYAVAIIAASYLALPAARVFGIKPFIPYTVVNEVSIFFLARTIVLIPVFVTLMVLVARRPGEGSLGSRAAAAARRWARAVPYALIPIALVVVVMAALSGPLFLPRVFAKMPSYFFIGVIIIGSALWLEDFMFYKIAFPALSRHGGESPQRLAVVVHGIVLDLVVVFAFLPLMKGLGVSIHLLGRLPLVLLILLLTPVFIGVSAVSLRLRRHTQTSLTLALMFAPVIVWLFTAPIGVRGF